MRFEDAVAEYAVQLEANGRSIHTRMQYARHLRALGAWLSRERPGRMIEEMGPADLAAFLASEQARTRAGGGPKRATTLNAMRSSLRTFFTFVHDAGHATANSARLIRRARCGTAPPRSLSDNDRDRLLAAFGAVESAGARRDELLVRLLLGTGLRIGSALALNVDDVDLERGELHLRKTKGDVPELVYLSADVVLRLSQYLEGRDAGPVFTTNAGSRLSTRHAARRFKERVLAAGLKPTTSPHTLRHTFATGLLRRTGDLAIVQAALRHRSMASTLVYVRVAPERVRQAIDG